MFSNRQGRQEVKKLKHRAYRVATQAAAPFLIELVELDITHLNGTTVRAVYTTDTIQ